MQQQKVESLERLSPLLFSLPQLRIPWPAPLLPCDISRHPCFAAPRPAQGGRPPLLHSRGGRRSVRPPSSPDSFHSLELPARPRHPAARAAGAARLARCACPHPQPLLPPSRPPALPPCAPWPPRIRPGSWSPRPPPHARPRPTRAPRHRRAGRRGCGGSPPPPPRAHRGPQIRPQTPAPTGRAARSRRSAAPVQPFLGQPTPRRRGAHPRRRHA